MSTSFPFTTISAPLNHTDGDERFYETVQWMIGLFFTPITCIPGVVGNAAIILIFTQKNMRSSTNVYLTALAISDFLKVFNDFLYFLVVLFKEIDNSLYKSAFVHMYPYAHFIFGYSTCVSALLTVSVAIERYILVCHPARSKTWTSVKKAKIFSVTIYIIVVLLNIPHMLRSINENN